MRQSIARLKAVNDNARSSFWGYGRLLVMSCYVVNCSVIRWFLLRNRQKKQSFVVKVGCLSM